MDSPHKRPVMRDFNVSFVASQPIPTGQNGRYIADDIFKSIFMNEKFCVLIKISLKFIHKGPIDNNPSLI